MKKSIIKISIIGVSAVLFIGVLSMSVFTKETQLEEPNKIEEKIFLKI